MNHRRTKDYFVDYQDGRLDRAIRTQIDEHLRACHACSEYYRKMALLLQPSDNTLLPNLKPGPFAGWPSAPQPAGPFRRWATVAAAAAMLVVAIVTGSYLGRSLSATTAQDSDTDLISAYYDAFSQSAFGSSLDAVVEGDAGETGNGS